MVDQPSWCGDHEIGTVSELGLLLFDVGLSDYEAGGQFCELVEIVEHDEALDGEFSGGDHDDDSGILDWVV